MADEHLRQAKPEFEKKEGDQSRPKGCEECMLEGSSWIKLRRCLTCGHIGCCDSSPKKHATGHYESTKHPVMQSAEPGEDWKWCYVHKEYI